MSGDALDHLGEGLLDALVAEQKARSLEAVWDSASAGQQSLLRHLTGRGAEDNRRNAKQVWPVQDDAEIAGKFRIRDRMGRRGVESSAQLMLVQDEQDCFDDVIEGDPAHPCAAVAEPAAQAEAEGTHE